MHAPLQIEMHPPAIPDSRLEDPTGCSRPRLPDPAGPPLRSEPLALLCLGTGLLLGWSALFYLFGALLLPWERDTGLSKSELSLGLTVAILTSALVAPVSGRLIDAGHGRVLLSCGALIGALGLGGLSLFTGQAGFVGAWAIIGIAQGTCLYEPTFSFLARVLRQRARRAITLVSLLGGLATLLAYPAAALLTDLSEWRLVVGGFAALTAFVTAPLMYAGGALLEPSSRHPRSTRRKQAGSAALVEARRRPVFWGLLASFALLAFAEGMILSHAVPAMVEFGQSEGMALLAMALIGPSQAVGRLYLLLCRPGLSPFRIASVAGCTLAGGIALMPLAGGQAGLALLAMILFGLGYGVTIVLKPVLVSTCLGYVSIGAILGAMALPCFVFLAAAPFAGALLWEQAGYALGIPVAALAAGCGSLGLVAVAVSSRGADSADPLRPA